MTNSKDPIEEMKAWLLDSVDFKDEPVQLDLLDSFTVIWPATDEPQEAYLVRFKMKSGVVGVGLTGPLTWCFVGDIPFDAIDPDLLLLFYIGWYIMFIVQENQKYKPPVDFGLHHPVYQQLVDESVNEITQVDALSLEDSTYYEVRGLMDGESCRIIVQDQEFIYIEEDEVPDLLPALYWVLGNQYLKNFETE